MAMKKYCLLLMFVFMCVWASAQQQHLNVGASANDHTGDPLRTAMIKVERNFTYSFDTAYPSFQLKTNMSGTHSTDPTKYPNWPAIHDYVDSTSHIMGALDSLCRYSAYSSGSTNVEVLSYGLGITATLGNTNEITFTIPVGVRIVSAKIRVGSLSSLKVFMGTNDMGNSSLSNSWMPLTQAWREDTGQQLMGVTCLMDVTGAAFDKFTVNGLINTTVCQIRISF